MTKYEELDVEGLSAGAVVARVMPGDRLTIEGPGAGDVSVRVVDEDGYVSSVLVRGAFSLERIAYQTGVAITRIERPIPEVELPTVPGYYEAAGLPMSRGYNPYELRSNGHWYSNSCKVTESRMRELMPLTRLVPETATAKLADRLDPKLVGALMDNISERDYDTYQEDGAVLIAAIDNGELDK